jgi:hypothetical protein
MPLGPVFARVGSTVVVGGVVVVVVATGFVVVVVTGAFAVVVVTGGLVVVVVTGGFVVVVVVAVGAAFGPVEVDSGGGDDVSGGSHAAPTITSANAQISTPARRRVTAAPIRPPGE